MKRKILNVMAIILSASILSSCATVFGGKVTTCQRTKPAQGQPARAVRPVPLVANILLFWPGVIVDFATGAAYKPCDK